MQTLSDYAVLFLIVGAYLLLVFILKIKGHETWRWRSYSPELVLVLAVAFLVIGLWFLLLRLGI